MSEQNTPPSFSGEERDRIITDIMHWKCELETDHDFPPEEFQAFVDKLRSMDDPELKEFWEEHVGEWLASRDDLTFETDPEKPKILDWHEVLRASLNGSNHSDVSDFDAWLEMQFEKLINGEQRDYGYVVNVDIKPKASRSRSSTQVTKPKR
jgi:hypothetical protein